MTLIGENRLATVWQPFGNRVAVGYYPTHAQVASLQSGLLAHSGCFAEPALNTTPSQIVLTGVLRLLRPLVRLLLQHGVPYTAFAAALKPVFVEAARSELASNNKAQTDSAVTLLSGVHRRDIRQITRGGVGARAADRNTANNAAEALPSLPHLPLGLVGQVVARWMSESSFTGRKGRPRGLPRSGGDGSFDALVARISSDVRPRAMLDEMLRLGVAQEDGNQVRLELSGLAPRQGLAEGAALMADNLHDHAEAAAANLRGEANFLEQALYVDAITEASAAAVHKAAVTAWKKAFKTVAAEANARFDADAGTLPAAERKHRARFGVYFYSEHED